MTWDTAILGFLSFERASGKPATTCGTRRQHLEHMARRIGSPPPAVTTDSLIDYMSRQDWKPETRRGRRSTFRRFWAWGAAHHGWENAAAGLPVVKPGQPRPRPCPDRAYTSALVAARPREQLMLRLSAELGLRRAEVARVHASDLVDDLGGLTLIVHGKGDKQRNVPLPTSLGRHLVEVCAGGFAFPGDDAGHLSPRWVGKLIAGLLPDDLTMHTLRHRFASRAWAEGIEVWVLQDLLGHASADTTRRYVAIPNTAARAAIDRLSA